MKRKADHIEIQPVGTIVRDLIIAAPEGIHSEGTVKQALDEMNTEGVASSPVTDDNAQFKGTVSESELNRKVGGKGHDPAIEPVDRQLDLHSVYCFDDDTVEKAKEMMAHRKLNQLPVLNRSFKLLGTVTMEMIESRE